MEAFLYWMMVCGGLLALVAGGVLVVFGDRLHAADQRAGRVKPNAMTPAAQRRFGLAMAVLGGAFLLLAFFL